MSVILGTRDWLSEKREEHMPAGSLRARFTLGVFWSIAGAVISRGFTLVSSIICARFLGRTGFGELGMVQSTAGTFGIFAGLGLGLTATKYVAKLREQDRGRVGRILALSSFTALLSSAVMAAVLVVSAHYLSSSTLAAPHLAGPLAVGAGLVFFGGLNGAQTGALAGFEAFRTIARVNIVAGISSFPLVVIGVWRWGLSGAVWGLVAAIAVNWVLNHLALRRECDRFGIQCDYRSFHKEWQVLVKFSLPAFLASVVVGPALWICNAFLVHQPDGYSQLGLYSAADRWRLMVLFVPASVFGMVVPVLSNLYGSEDELSFQRVFRANLVLNAFLAALPAIMIAALAIPIMSAYGPQFRAGWPTLILLAFTAIAEAVNNIYMARLICADRMWWRFALDVQLVVVLLLAAWWWIPHWGAFGMAMAYMAAMSALCLSLMLLTQGPLKGKPALLKGS
ncbi:MAG TPA: oligosaccharide flippase family protein [Candidatus Acidoferrales bacterium]|nr:oligosaccharide flippase family protein [Candidatus Acidoferrales bacterium]